MVCVFWSGCFFSFGSVVGLHISAVNLFLIAVMPAKSMLHRLLRQACGHQVVAIDLKKKDRRGGNIKCKVLWGFFFLSFFFLVSPE